MRVSGRVLGFVLEGMGWTKCGVNMERQIYTMDIHMAGIIRCKMGDVRCATPNGRDDRADLQYVSYQHFRHCSLRLRLRLQQRKVAKAVTSGYCEQYWN